MMTTRMTTIMMLRNDTCCYKSHKQTIGACLRLVGDQLELARMLLAKCLDSAVRITQGVGGPYFELLNYDLFILAIGKLEHRTFRTRGAKEQLKSILGWHWTDGCA